MKPVRRSRGIASVLAILMLAVLFTLAISIAAVSNQNELQSANLAGGEAARLQAEGGLSFLLQRLCASSPPAGIQGDGLLNWLGASLASQLDGTPNLQGAVVSTSGGTVTVPSIVTDAGAGRSFSATVTMDSNTVVRLRVTGGSGAMTRTAQIGLNLTSSISEVFKYGVAARGPIQMKGNASLLGATYNHEADLFTAAYVDVPVSLFGNVVVEGDISLSDPGGTVSLSSNAIVAGQTGDARFDHVHIGVGNVEFPEVDPSVFEPFATRTISDTNLFDRTLSNIRIKAGTNPTFSGNTTIRGIVFVETPNKVTFSGNLFLTGLVVTEDAGHNDTANNSIKFAGNSFTSGVENLPDGPEYAALKSMPGSFILAPGFQVELAGNFGMASGCLAAEQFKFSGNTTGTVKGTIISYGETTFLETGNANITIDRVNAPAQPPGFSSHAKLVPDMDTYRE